MASVRNENDSCKTLVETMPKSVTSATRKIDKESRSQDHALDEVVARTLPRCERKQSYRKKNKWRSKHRYNGTPLLKLKLRRRKVREKRQKP